MGCEAVLVVEDDDDARETLCEALEDEGYWVFRAANGLEALGILRNMSHQCLILLDINMPIMNGYQFMDRLKELPDSPHARHVIVVAAASNDVPPGTPVVKKPVDMKLLLRYMAAHDDEHVSH